VTVRIYRARESWCVACDECLLYVSNLPDPDTAMLRKDVHVLEKHVNE
jgi:hypothetical protein